MRYEHPERHPRERPSAQSREASRKRAVLGSPRALPREVPKTGITFLVIAGLLLVAVSVTSFFALNFTGCTSFTSLSGTQRETLRAVPVQILGLLAGLLICCWPASA